MVARALSLDAIAEKLFAKSIPEPNSGCRLWEACTDTTGYGLVRHNGKQRATHRLSWLVHRGAIPKGLDVLHKCDVRQCINPDHLFLGTHTDNMRDMTAKGRHGMTTLTEDDVRAIRAASGTQQALADRYNVSQSIISDIKIRKSWKHLS
jgi:hypothetical protein